MIEIDKLKSEVRQFVSARDWDQFHSPKNLSMALAVEAAELMERFQWLTDTQSAKLTKKDSLAAAEEAADVYIYLLLLADKLGIDLVSQARKKLKINARKYPVRLAKGRATKSRNLKAKQG